MAKVTKRQTTSKTRALSVRTRETARHHQLLLPSAEDARSAWSTLYSLFFYEHREALVILDALWAAYCRRPSERWTGEGIAAARGTVERMAAIAIEAGLEGFAGGGRRPLADDAPELVKHERLKEVKAILASVEGLRGVLATRSKGWTPSMLASALTSTVQQSGREVSADQRRDLEGEIRRAVSHASGIAAARVTTIDPRFLPPAADLTRWALKYSGLPKASELLKSALRGA